MWYLFDQNNSYGYFEVNDKLCAKLFIEANNEEEANEKAISLGCYFNGVEEGIDCPCCGDRWSDYMNEVNLDEINETGYQVSCYSINETMYQTRDRWYHIYGKYDIVGDPQWVSEYSRYRGTIRFRNIEEYAQYMADNYHWTTPDCRIFYLDGTVKEIFAISDKNSR